MKDKNRWKDETDSGGSFLKLLRRRIEKWMQGKGRNIRMCS